MTTTSAADTGFTPEQRRALLDDYFVSVQALEELAFLDEGQDPAFRQRLSAHEALYTEAALAMRQDYTRTLPTVPLSRCPLSGDALEHSFDPYGLDGLWWDHDAAARPDEALPPTFVGLTGALSLGGPPAWTPFLVKPGPAAPFVVPRLLESGATAVISTVTVGPHTGYAIAYFSEHPVDVPRFNEWGANHYRVFEDGVPVGWDEAADPASMDFDLRPWLEREQVAWIEAGDPELRLWTGAAECPYLDLAGTREPQRFQYGTAWTPRT